MSKLTELLNYTKPTLNSVLGVKSKLEQLLSPSQPLGGGGGGSWGSNPEALAVSNKTALDRFMNPMIINQGITNKQVTEATPKTKLGILAMAADMADPKIGAGVGLLSKIPGTGIVSDVAKSAVNGAKKYKSADEFVKAQGGEIYYHATKSNIDNFGKIEKGTYFTKDLSSAKNLIGKDAKIIESKLDIKNPFVANKNNLKKVFKDFCYGINDKNEIDSYIKKLSDDFADSNADRRTDVFNYAKEKGYDSVIIPDDWNGGLGTMESVVVFDKNAIKTKSQLIDIWNKANKK